MPGRSQAAKAERLTASRYWGTLLRELRGTNKLAAANGHALKRLVMAWIIYDRAATHVARTGPIVKAPRTGTPMHSPWFTAMTQAGKMAGTLEAELTITPRSRDDGGTLPLPHRPSPADRYLRRPNRTPQLTGPADGDQEDPDGAA